MKRYIVLLLCLTIGISTINCCYAKASTNSELSNAIRLYKAGDYTQCYSKLQNVVVKDPSNAVAYYYLAITSAQIGKRTEAIENYEKVISLAPNTKVSSYATKGKICIETPDLCHDTSSENAMDRFIRESFGSGFSTEARSNFEKNKIDNLMREMNRKDDISPSEFKNYKDFSGYNKSSIPTDEEIVSAMRVLQKAGFANALTPAYNNIASDLSFLYDNNKSNSSYDMMNLFMGQGGSNFNPQLIQAMLNNQMSTGF